MVSIASGWQSVCGLTLAARITVSNGGSGLDGIAGLSRAVTDAVCPVALGAEAADVIGAARVGRALRDGGHVRYAEIL